MSDRYEWDHGGLEFVWRGGEYVTIHGLPLGPEVINLWDYEKGAPRIAREFAPFVEECQAWIRERIACGDLDHVSGGAYALDGYNAGVAWAVRGYDGDDWSRVVVCMVGDNRPESCDVDDLLPLSSESYCAGCGQVGCGHG